MIAYEPFEKQPYISRADIQDLELKGLFVRGIIGRDFRSIKSVYRCAKKAAEPLFKTNKDKICVLCCEETAYNGFLVLVTNCTKKEKQVMKGVVKK